MAGRAVASTPCVNATSYANTVPIYPSGLSNVNFVYGSGLTTPWESTGCASINGNLFGLGSGGGDVYFQLGVTSNSPGLALSGTLGYLGAGTTGFPETLYGYKPSAGIESNQAAAVTFPLMFPSLPNLWLMTNYRSGVSNPNQPVDFSYDFLLTQDYKPTATRNGDVEVKVVLYHNDEAAAGTRLVAQNYTAPVWVNGTLQNMVFNVYAAPPSANNQPVTLTFVLVSNNDTATQGGIASGYVGFNLQPLLVRAQRVALATFGIAATTFDAEYLNGVELGNSFAADTLDNPNNTFATVAWNLDNYCLVKPKTGTPPAQANAASFVCP